MEIQFSMLAHRKAIQNHLNISSDRRSRKDKDIAILAQSLDPKFSNEE